MKILLVDDEIVALNALKKRVDWVKYGFVEVFTARDGEQARSILKQEKIDLVLCDIEMPGESGLDLVEYIKDTYPQTDCIMVTCHADFGYVKKSMRVKAFDYILKPIDYEELIGDMTLNRLHEIFKSIVRKQEDKIDPIRSQYGNIEKEEIDMDSKMLYVEAFAREHKHFSFRRLLEKQSSKMEIIVTFLIILELMKTGKIVISQENIFDDIMIDAV